MRALIGTYVLLSLSFIAYGAGAEFLKVETLVEEAKVPQARFEIYAGDDGEHWWRLKGPNNQVIASGEGYEDKASALLAIRNVQEYAANASIEEFDAR